MLVCCRYSLTNGTYVRMQYPGHFILLSYQEYYFIMRAVLHTSRLCRRCTVFAASPKSRACPMSHVPWRLAGCVTRHGILRTPS